MNTRLLAVGVVLAGAAHAYVVRPDASSSPWKAVADRVHATVIEVHGAEGENTVTYGAGVLIGHGLAVTTLHAVAVPSAAGKMTPLKDVRVLVPDVGPMDARVMAGAPDLDLAILRLSSEGASLAGAPISAEPPAEGEVLVAMGAGDDAITALGVVVSAVSGDLFALTSKRMIDSRFWGGPLFDAEGRLVGIQLTSLGSSKAISARVIQRMLDQRPVSPGLPGPP
jgi:S1-C subfamily serine protease